MKSVMIVALLFAIVACENATKEASVATNEKEPGISKIQLKDLNEQPINLEEYKGKTIFINFWATWCRPCIEEMPSIEKAQNILQNEKVVFILASSESASEIEEFRNTRGYKFNYARIENSEELGIQALPTTFILDSDGQLAFSEQGYRKWDEKDNILMIRKIAKNND
jgi:thiol-disulfide isomerase/thioredoxin